MKIKNLVVAVALLVGWKDVGENVVLVFVAGAARKLDPVFNFPGFVFKLQLARAMTALTVGLVEDVALRLLRAPPIFAGLLLLPTAAPQFLLLRHAGVWGSAVV